MNARLPVFYGWIIVGIVFVTMAIGVNARTSFSLLFPPILEEFGWDRAIVAGIFSFGFFASALVSPFSGRMVDRRGPRLVIEIGVVVLVAGLCLATLAREVWQLYATLGLLVGVGGNLLGYSVQSVILPAWFARKRGLAIGIAFSGVGIGSIVLLPWLQAVIARDGWRFACLALALIIAIVLFPLNLLLRRRPQDLGLYPDGDAAPHETGRRATANNIVDIAWASTDWTLARAARTARFWWIALGYFSILYAWYAVQVHQTKYLTEIGVSPMQAAWALGLVSLVGIPGQIVFGHVSDRIGREWCWAIGCLGFVICFAALIALRAGASPLLLYTMVIAQGFLGYSMTSVFGPIVAEIFEGPHFGAIFGTLMVFAIGGGAVGPWVTGLLHDHTGNYDLAFWIALGFSALSAITIFIAAPRKVRLVAGRMPK
ncbi:MAG TPA: MFS transporter [Xanthobacteraceae bacterium]|nr:MFS transporter [Xanthobacteraceae bacterium]